VNLLHAVGSQLHVGRKVLAALALEERAVDKRRLDHALLALGGLEERLGEASAGKGHGEGGRAGAGLGLHHLVAAELHAADVVVQGLALELVAGLGQERDNGDARVAADDGDALVGGIRVLDLADEAAGADDVERGDAEETLGVVDATGLEDLGGDGDSGVDLAGLSRVSKCLL
jgi:hypothetical protein